MGEELSIRTRIEIRGLQVFGHHGVHASERERGGWFLVDAVLEVPAPEEDALESTVNYTAVIETICELSESKPFRLLESFARALAEGLLARFPRVERAQVRVRKRLSSPRAVLHWVAAEVELGRGSLWAWGATWGIASDRSNGRSRPSGRSPA
jgi:dihydroneopterin aldolase